jgi:hypothetical protein
VPFAKSLLNKDYIPPDIDTLDEVTYAINVVDQRTGVIGSMVFDEEMYRLTGTHWSVSPVCMSVDALFDYLRERGFTEHSDSSMFTVRRAKE